MVRKAAQSRSKDCEVSLSSRPSEDRMEYSSLSASFGLRVAEAEVNTASALSLPLLFILVVTNFLSWLSYIIFIEGKALCHGF